MIKKIGLVLLTMIGLVGVVSAKTISQITPQKLAEAKALYTDASKPTNWDKINAGAIVKISELDQNVTSIAEYEKVFLQVATELKGDQKLAKRICSAALLWWDGLVTDTNRKDAYDYIMINGDTFIKAYMINAWGDKLALTISQKNQIYFTCLKSVRAGVCKGCFTQYMNTLPEIEEATAKTQLKTLNRLFTPMLLKDKTTWEPYVAQIRTALETY